MWRNGTTASGVTGLLGTVLVGACLLAGPAVAQGWGPSRSDAEARMGPRNGDGAGSYRDRELQRNRETAFRRGYEAGRADERARGAMIGGRDRAQMGLVWNDTHQSEAYERLERATADLRRALVLMRRQPDAPHVQRAVVQAREALERAQNALTWLPALPERRGQQRYPRAYGIGPERASGGWEG